MKKLIPILSLIQLTTLASSSEKLKTFFDYLYKKDKIMGSVYVAKNNKEVFSYAYGLSDAKRNIKATTNTLYSIGSISKTYTSTMIFKQIEEGKVSLNTKLEKYFPTIPNSKKITIENLLRHTSGLDNFTSKPDYETFRALKQSRKKLIERFVKQGTIFKPGERAQYSNSAYVLLSFIVEDNCKCSYPQALERYITKPLKLKHTRLYEQSTNDKLIAKGHIKTSKWDEIPRTHPSIPLGAGAIMSTAKEVSLFFNALFAGKIISKKSLTKMKEMKKGYGLGVFHAPFYGRKSLGHTGGIDGFRSIAFLFEDDQTMFVHLSNGSDMRFNDATIGLMSIQYGKNYEFPSFEIRTLPKKQLEEFVGTYKTKKFPLDIKIMIKGERLFAQATGQSSFPLSHMKKNKFEFKSAGITTDFVPSENKMIFIQNGNKIIFKKN